MTNFSQVMQDINADKIAPLYLLTGEEALLHRQVQQAVVEKILSQEERATNLHVFEHDIPFPQFQSLVCGVPFLGTRQVIIIRHTRLFGSSQSSHRGEGHRAVGEEEKGDWAVLLQNLPRHSYVIFSTLHRADARLALLRTVKEHGVVVELVPLRPSQIRPWVTQKMTTLGKKMSTDAWHYLLTMLSGEDKVSLARLDGELEKVALFAGTRREITATDLAAVLTWDQAYSVFALLNALGHGKRQEALQILCRLHRQGEQPVRFIALLARQIRLLWQAQELTAAGLNNRAVAERLNVPTFVAENLVRQSRHLPEKVLARLMLHLAAMDRQIKAGVDTGLEDMIALLNNFGG